MDTTFAFLSNRANFKETAVGVCELSQALENCKIWTFNVDFGYIYFNDLGI